MTRTDRRIGIIGTGATPSETGEAPAPIRGLAGADFVPELLETRLNVFPMTPYDRGLTALAYLDCAIEAAKAGYDAVFINTFGDYGIDEIRSATDMVVVGAGEASIAMAGNLGRRFSIVTIWPPKLNFIYGERLRSTGTADRCASIRHVLSDAEVDDIGGAVGAMSGLKDRRADLLDRVMETIETAVLQDGADTILLGCTCMAPAAPEIAERSPVPVLESMRTGYKTVETLLSLGLRHSAAAYPRAKPENLAAVDALIAGQGSRNLGGDCEVCILTDEAAE